MMGGQVAQSLTREGFMAGVPGLILTGEGPPFALAHLEGMHRKLHGLSPNSKTESENLLPKTVAPRANSANRHKLPASTGARWNDHEDDGTKRRPGC